MFLALETQLTCGRRSAGTDDLASTPVIYFGNALPKSEPCGQSRTAIRDETAALLLLRLLVGVDQVAGFVLRRREHGLERHAAPDVKAGALLDVVILHLQHAGLRPLAVRAELDVAHN